MSLGRPLHYIGLRVDAEECENSEHWGQCYGCYRRVRVRDLQLLQHTRRSRSWTWVCRPFCGECYAIVLLGDIGIPIPN